MDEFKDQDDLDIQDIDEEVQVNIFAEEELTEGKNEAIDEEIAIDIGQTAESLLEVIKSDSLYGLERKAMAEEFEPGDIASVAAGVTVDEGKAKPVSGELTEHSELDEPAEAIHIQEEPPQDYIQHEVEEQEFDLEQAERSRRRLRKVLVVCLVILFVLIIINVIFFMRNLIPSSVKNPDSDTLQTSSAGISTTQFQAIDANRIPNLITIFGMTPEEAVPASGSNIRLDAEATPATDASMPNIKTTRTGWLTGDDGVTLATITFGMNEAGKIEYVFSSFDLDALSVADARFDELVASNVVAASILTGIGIDDATVQAAQLTTDNNPSAVKARDMSKQEIAEFTGPTNKGGAPATWKVIETYDHSAGTTIGDNSVIRTLGVDLR